MRLFTPVFGVDMESPDIVRVAVEAVRQGYAVVPVAPGTKKASVCTLTAREFKAAGGKDHMCGVYHALTDDKVTRRVMARLVKEHGDHRLNLGIVAWPSRMICVDADTAIAVREFQQDWAAATGDAGYLDHTPTVRTPGVMDKDGVWIHKDGGHYLYVLPEGLELGLDLSTVKPEGRSYDIRWGWSMSVVPPSVRPEGPYLPGGNVLEAPAFVLAHITTALAGYRERVAIRGTMFANDDIATWSQHTDWSDLLVPDGWEPTGKVDGCGCAIYTRPGEDVSTFKSATAHDTVCSRYEMLESHGPLHIWTDHPPAPLDDWIVTNGRTVTKLTYFALTRYDGDLDQAKIAAGIDPDPSSWFTDDVAENLRKAEETSGETGETESDIPVPPRPPRTPQQARLDQLVRGGLEEMGLAWTQERHDGLLKSIQGDIFKITSRALAQRYADQGSSALSGDTWLPPSEESIEQWFAAMDEAAPTIMRRTDGICLIPSGRVSVIVSLPGAGKTWGALLAALQILAAGGKCLYMDMEDSVRAFRQRCKHIGYGEVADQAVREGRLQWIRPEGMPLDVPGFVEYAGTFDMLVVDVTNRLITRSGGDPSVGNLEIMRLYDTIFDPVSQLGTAVLLLDHPSKPKPGRDLDVMDMVPGGGALKMNNVSGIAIGLRVEKPFSKGSLTGQVTMFCTKSRTGDFEQGAIIGVLTGRPDIAGEVDDDDGDAFWSGVGMRLEIRPPGKPETEGDRIAREVQEMVTVARDQVVPRIVALLTERGAPMLASEVRRKLTPNHRKYFTDALFQGTSTTPKAFEEYVDEVHGKKVEMIKLPDTVGEEAPDDGEA